MRVALVVWKLYPSFVGGTERHSRSLARALAALGADVDVICADVPPGDDTRTLPFRIVAVGWPRGLPNLVAEYLFCRRAARRIATGRYDVAYGQNLALWQYVRDKRVPCVMSPYGMEPLKTPGWWAQLRGWPRRRAWRSTARRADLVISSGGKLTAEVEHLLGVEPARIAEIPIAVDLVEIDRLAHLSAGPVTRVPGTLLCVARLEFNKGVDVLLEACRLLEGRRALHVYVVGDGPLRPRLMRAAPSNVTLLGYQSDEELVRWYQRVEGLVLPSRYEALGTVILEAMACRLPIIATDIGAIATVVDEENGLRVAPGNAGAIARAIETFLSLTPEAKGRMGARSRERVVAKFGWDTVGPRTLDVLERLVPSASAITAS